MLGQSLLAFNLEADKKDHLLHGKWEAPLRNIEEHPETDPFKPAIRA